MGMRGWDSDAKTEKGAKQSWDGDWDDCKNIIHSSVATHILVNMTLLLLLLSITMEPMLDCGMCGGGGGGALTVGNLLGNNLCSKP